MELIVKNSVMTNKDDYEYNANGALTKDTDRGRQISYNLLNLPKTVGIYNDLVNGSTYYHYSADGVKRKVVYQWIEETVRKPEINDKGTPPVIGVVNYVTKTTDYVGNKIYEDGALSMILFGNGYIKGGKYHFYIRDHLGNNRVVVRDSTLAIPIPGQIPITQPRDNVNFPLNKIVVVQRTDYYPSGLPFPGRDNPEEQRFKYNGKEFDTMHGVNMYDYGARFYDAAIMRWCVTDPSAETYFHQTPYMYCGNNPMKFIDPDGCDKRLAWDYGAGTVTVHATFYYNRWNDDSRIAAETGRDDINNLKGYTYTDKTGKTWEVQFKLTTKDAFYPKIAANRDPEGNSIAAVEYVGKSKTVENAEKAGECEYKKHIKVKNVYKEGTTPGHEMLHALGVITHTSSGFMTQYLTNPNRNRYLVQQNIKEILQSGIELQEMVNRIINLLDSIFKVNYTPPNMRDRSSDAYNQMIDEMIERNKKPDVQTKDF